VTNPKPATKKQEQLAQEQRQHEQHERLAAALDARLTQQMASYRRQAKAKQALSGSRVAAESKSGQRTASHPPD
jgi:hypothetical protein